MGPPIPTSRKIRTRRVIAEALKALGCEYVFGIVGYPIIELGAACQRAGLKFIACRNEQAASYAAGAVGYLTGVPGVCLVVPGPGVIHALAGMANSSANGWPMICVAGSSELSQDGLGAFQESLPPLGGAQLQVKFVSEVCKYSAKATDPARVPFFLEQAMRYATRGRPGAAYVEVAGDTLREVLPEGSALALKAGTFFPPPPAPPPVALAPPSEVAAALRLLAGAERPLLVVGKGAAYAGAAPELREFVARTGCPWLPTPMGKGVLPDDHALCQSPARSFALRRADVILLVGCRLNWILHYGRPPRFAAGRRFIQVDILPEEIGASVQPAVGLCGDAKAICRQLVDGLDDMPFTVPATGAWVAGGLEPQRQRSIETFSALIADRSSPMNFYAALGIIDRLKPRDCIVVNEGSDTMDIGRTVLRNFAPRQRLDAGSWGTMGVGLGQAIAGALVDPNPGCVAVLGDSAFGFSGMEFEVVVRYKLPVVVIILNNNGIGAINPEAYVDERAASMGPLQSVLQPSTSSSSCGAIVRTHTSLQPTAMYTAGQSSTAARIGTYSVKALTPAARYEGLATALGATGVFVSTAVDLEAACADAFAHRPFRPTIINCMISTTASKGKPAAPPWGGEAIRLPKSAAAPPPVAASSVSPSSCSGIAEAAALSTTTATAPTTTPTPSCAPLVEIRFLPHDAPASATFTAAERNRVTRPHRVALHNGRLLPNDAAQLRQRGFTRVQFRSSVHGHLDRIENPPVYRVDGAVEAPESVRVRDVFFRDAEALVQELTGADHVFAVSHAVRNGTGNKASRGVEYLTAYATFAHCDYTTSILPHAPKMMCKRGVPLERARRMQYCFYNLWAPVNVVETAPLALLDWQSTSQEDVRTVTLGYNVTPRTKQDGITQVPSAPPIAQVTHNPSQRWFWYPCMQPGEALVFTQVDGRRGYARHSFHTAVKHHTRPDPSPRRSVEVRFVCGWLPENPRSGEDGAASSRL